MKKSKIEPDIAGLLDKMQQQLVFLEKKIDTLIQKASEKPFEPQRNANPVPRHSHPTERQGPSFHHPKQYHRAICADCKKECEVPFRPTGDRPVYCKECFSKRKAGASFKERHDNKPREEAFVPRRDFGAKERRPRRHPGEKKANFRKRKK